MTMKKKWFFKIVFIGFLASFAVSSNTFASVQSNLMEEGNTYYQKNDYQKAIDAYEKILNMGYESSTLFYNMGNAFYREGQIGYAILNYEKALKLSPGDNDIQHNLALANTKTVDKINTMPSFFLFEWWESLLALFSLTGWTYLTYSFYALLLICVAFYFLVQKPKLQRYIFFAGLGSLGLMIISTVLLIIVLNRDVNIKSAVVVEQVANVKLSPDSKSNDAFVIHEGLKVSVEDSVDDWLEIRLQDGKVGWLPKSDLRMI